MITTILQSKTKVIATLLLLTFLCHEVSAAKSCKVDSDCTKNNWAEVCVKVNNTDNATSTC